MKKLCILTASVVILCSCHHQAEEARESAVLRDTIHGVPCCIYLPDVQRDDVQSTKGESRKYPVLYLHHGMYGNENDWTEQGNLVHWMDSLRACGEVKEMVVIMPDNCPGRPTSEEERAHATNGEWENHFAAFMAEAERKYPISSDPSRRAIAGLSMGGYHTMMVSHVAEGQFAYVGMFSPATFEHHASVGAKVFWLGIGKEDFLYEPFQEYRRWLDANHAEYTYYESTGGHTWDNWQDYLCRFLPKLFKE